MQRVFLTATAMAALFPVSGAANAQAVTEEEIRCVVQNDQQMCQIAKEKKFSLANISTKPSSAASATAPVRAPAAAAVKRPTASYGRPATRPVATAGTRGTGANPATLNMQMNFLLGSAELTPGARAQADVFAKVLKETPAGASFAIEGHTDTVGTPEQNEKLSRARAESVVSYLVEKGVPSARLTAVGYGFKRPKAGLAPSNPGNRRVEIVRQ